jgi:hypothetical protein
MGSGEGKENVVIKKAPADAGALRDARGKGIWE